MTTKSPITFVDAGTLETNGLVGKVSRWSYIPKSQQSWTNNDIIRTLDDENKNTIIPLINSLNEEYFVVSYIFQIPSSPTWNGAIPIPSDAVGLDLRDVWATSGNLTQNSLWAGCRRVNPNQFNYPTSSFNWLGTIGPPYYIENNRVQFYMPQAINSSTGFTTIKLRYFKKPSTLVSRATCAVVTAIDPVLNTITLDKSNTASGAGFSTGQTFDFIELIQPFVFDAAAITPINVNVTTLTTTLTLDPTDTTTVQNVQVGDMCCPVGTAPVLQYMPEEANAVLCQTVVCRMQDAQGNEAALKRGQTKLDKYVADLQRLLTPKVADQTAVMVSQSDLFSANASFTGTGNFAGGIGSR